MLKVFRQKIRLSLALLAAVILLIFLHYSKIFLPVENLLIRIFSPLQQQVYILGVKINNFYNVARFQKDLLKTNLELEAKVEELVVENAQIKTELFKQKEQKDQLDFLAAAGFEAVSAQIVGRGVLPNSQTIILNRGRKDGVNVGFAVIAGKGIMVGKIVKVNNNSSQAILINDSHSSLAANILNKNQTKGVVIGERGLSLKMELIPQDQPVAAGNIVVTSGLEKNIPRGLVIGQVEQVVWEPNSFFQQAFLKPLINFDDLIVVSILKNIYND